jgi:hypothetical protein
MGAGNDGAREGPLAEGAPEQRQEIRCCHVPAKPPQQFDGLDGAQEDPVGEQQ